MVVFKVIHTPHMQRYRCALSYQPIYQGKHLCPGLISVTIWWAKTDNICIIYSQNDHCLTINVLTFIIEIFWNMHSKHHSNVNWVAQRLSTNNNWPSCPGGGGGTPILGHGRELPWWWPPFFKFSIWLGSYVIPHNDLIDPLFLQKYSVCLYHIYFQRYVNLNFV